MTAKKNVVELIIVLVAMIVPQLILASEVDGDEFAKATSGIVLAGTMLAAYKIYKGVKKDA